MSKYQIKSWRDGSILYECEAESLKEAVKKAVKAGANLADADLADADLTGTNLAWANLTGANLTRANLDYAAWPLWCGSFNVKADARLVAQLLCHLGRLDVSGCDEPWVQEAMQAIKPYVNKFCEFRNDAEEI